jgi:hypothetical protein
MVKQRYSGSKWAGEDIIHVEYLRNKSWNHVLGVLTWIGGYYTLLVSPFSKTTAL